MTVGVFYKSCPLDTDTLALGAIAITIHSAKVKGSDLGGKSDPYVTVSYAKYSKPLFSTRIILGETEPTWRATAVVLVKADAFKVNERLALRKLTASSAFKSLC